MKLSSFPTRDSYNDIDINGESDFWSMKLRLATTKMATQTVTATMTTTMMATTAVATAEADEIHLIDISTEWK